MELNERVIKNKLTECNSNKELIDLLKSGYPVNVEDLKGNTALFTTSLEQSKILINYGADVNHENDGGETPLFFSDLKKTKLLLENGADISVSNIENLTPLDYAINRKDDQKAEFLVRKGVSLDHVDLSGFKTREYASQTLIELHDNLLIKKNKKRMKP